MAKKKLAAKRSTKAGKRRPTKRVAAKRKGPVFQPGVFQPGVFQGLPPSGASQQKLSPALQSTQGVIEPPPAAVSNAPLEGRIDTRLQVSMRTDASVIPAPVPITPTVYPDSPQGTIIVQNYVTINVQRDEFSRFNKNVEALIGELRQSNAISGEVRDKLLSELREGKELLNAPKPQRGLIDLLLVTPLKWLAEKSGSAIVSKLATDALELLSRLLL